MLQSSVQLGNEFQKPTFIWCTSIENELSKRRAGRKTANKRSGSIFAPAHEPYMQIKRKKMVVNNSRFIFKKELFNLQIRIPSPTFPNRWLVPYSANKDLFNQKRRKKNVFATAYINRWHAFKLYDHTRMLPTELPTFINQQAAKVFTPTGTKPQK